MKNFLTGGTDKSFTDCIQALSRSLENRNSSPELRDLFFKLIEKRDQLPENVSEETTSNFVYCLVEIAYSDPDEREALKAITALFRYLKTDLNVFTHFKPSRILIRRLKLDKYLISNLDSTSDITETILDFAIFLLRYYEAVDYEDFSDLATINAKIKRAELHRVWIDIEEIIGRLDGFDQGSKQNLNNTSAAFGEIFSYMDKIKKDVDYQKELIKGHEGDFPHGRPILGDRGGELENPFLRHDDRLGIQKKVDNFGTKLDKLKYPDKSEGAYPRPDNILGPRGGRVDDSIELPRDVRGHVEEIKKTVNTRLSKLESDFALIKSLRYGMQEGSGADIVQNLLGAINNLTDRVDALEKGGTAIGLSAGPKSITADAFSLRPLGDLDLKIKVASLEKKFESLDIKASTGYALQKIPGEIEKVKQDFLALEARMSKDLSHVSDALRKGDFAIQNDLQRLMEMVTLMQKDIEGLQNYPVSGTSSGIPQERGSFDPDLKKRLSQLELKVDRTPWKSELDLVVSRLSNLEKSALGAVPKKPGDDPYSQSSPTRLPDPKPAGPSATDTKVVDMERKMNALELQINMFKQEVTNMKAQANTQDNSPSKSSTKGADNGLDVDRIERFVQEFVNKQALIKIRRIMQVSTPATQKMDKFEWVIRNLEFLSPNLPQNLLLWTQETILDPSVTNPNRDALTITKHTSEAVGGVVELIKGCLETQNPTLRELLDSYLAFLEVLLFSDVNLEKAVYYGVVDLLFYILDPACKYTEDEKRCALKCVLPCSRLTQATNIIFSSNKHLKVLAEMMSKPWDTDSLLILTNFFSKAFSEENKFGTVDRESRDIVAVLFNNMVVYEKSGELVEELLQAIMNFTRKPQNLDLIKEPQVFQKIIEIAKTTRQPNLKEYATGVLKNSQRKQQFNDYFKAQGFQ